MIQRRLAHLRLKNLVFATLAVMTGLQMLVWRPLFADGAFLLMRILDTRRFHDSNEPSRVFDYWFTQFPTVFAVKLGVTDLHVLTYLFASWMILSFMLFWFLALFLLRKDFLFWPFTALFVLAYFNGGFFTVGEYNLDYALTALCFAAMLRRRANSPAIYGLLLFAALLSTLTYASTMFFGIVLAATAFMRWRREVEPCMKIYWLALILVFIASAAIGVWAWLDPNHPLNKARAASYAVLLFDRQYWLVLGVVGLAALQCVMPWRGGRDASMLAQLAVAVVLLTGIFLPHPMIDFAIRAYTGMALCVAFAALVWFRFGGYRHVASAEKWQAFDPVKHCAVPVTVLLVALSSFDVERSLAFGPYLNSFRAQVNSHSGIVPWEASMAGVPNDNIFGWSWTYPSMSLVLRRDAHAAIIRNARRNTEEQPFEPESPPDLSRYYPHGSNEAQ